MTDLEYQNLAENVLKAVETACDRLNDENPNVRLVHLDCLISTVRINQNRPIGLI